MASLHNTSSRAYSGLASRQSGGGGARRPHGNTVPLADRFWTKVKSTRNLDACWLWQGTKSPLGYGLIAESRNGRKKQRWLAAHRVAWELANGQTIPAGMVICHHCDRPGCCNPRHLFLGTQLDNIADAIKKGRLTGRPLRRRSQSFGAHHADSQQSLRDTNVVQSAGEPFQGSFGKRA